MERGKQQQSFKKTKRKKGATKGQVAANGSLGKKHWAFGLGKTAVKWFKHLPAPGAAKEDVSKQELEMKRKAGKRNTLVVMPYKLEQKLLLVGEGNFSFTAALADKLGSARDIVATSFDHKDTLEKKYPDAAEFENDIEALGGQVDHGVDATQLHKCESLVEAGPWDCVIFNFPHVGFGIKDQLKNIRANQEMLRDFLASATTMLHGTGEIHITIKRGEPYESWKVVKLGTETAGLKLKNAFDFVPAQYPKYRHRRTLGFAEGISTKQNEDIIAGAKTYVFVKASAQPGPSGDTGKPGKKRKGPPEKEKGGEQGNGKKRSGKKERRSDQNRSRNH